MQTKKITRVFISYNAVIHFLEQRTYEGAAELENALFAFVSDEGNDNDRLNAWIFETAAHAITEAKADGRALIVQAELPVVTEGPLEDDLASASDEAPEFVSANYGDDDDEEEDETDDNTPKPVRLTYDRINRFLARWDIAPLTGSPDSHTDMIPVQACVPSISDNPTSIEVLWAPTKVWAKARK